MDLAICLSRRTQQQLMARYRRSAELTPVLGCGPDLNFPGYEPLGSEFVVSAGKTNRDIAQILGLSPRTVDKHLEQIYSKLGVENRTAAAAIAVKTRNL